MFDAAPNPACTDDAEIAHHEVSEDGVMWRPFDPARDRGRNLHTRIVFAPPASDRASSNPRTESKSLQR